MGAAERVMTTDAEIDAAIAHAKASPRHRVVAARYDRPEDLVVITLSDGVIVGFPRKRLQGLATAKPLDLTLIEIQGPGTGLYWPRLDVAHYVPGLLDGVFGTQAWMARNGKRGGAVTSEKKARSSKANGAKGGRPRRPKALT